jgi:hypothetical protein
MQRWPGIARTLARPRRGRGREVMDRLMGGVHEAEREDERVRKETTPTDWPHRATRRREGEKGRVGWRRQAILG